MGDFRPISLLNTCIKLITKLLADRLQTIILQLVHQNQYGFIKSRSIQDCLAWSFEYLYLCHKSEKEMVIFKLDFEKAFDTIEHQVIIDILQVKGFRPKLINWIKVFLDQGHHPSSLMGSQARFFTLVEG